MAELQFTTLRIRACGEVASGTWSAALRYPLFHDVGVLAMAQHPARDRRDNPSREYVSHPAEAQHRWTGGFYTGEDDTNERARKYAERPHGWGEYEANYGVARGEWRRVDSQPADQHRGKGPKGYRRSAQRTRELICERLTDNPHIDASDIEVQVQDGSIFLSGSVPNRSMKHAAEELVTSIAPHEEIENRLRVANSVNGGRRTADGADLGQG